MQFLSDNAASVHPYVWDKMRGADSPDMPYDGDALSAALDHKFSELFGRDCAALWAATGTAANCLALAQLCPPYGGVICHKEAHIESDEAGAPGFFLHGAKLMLVDGPAAKLTCEAVSTLADSVRPDVHQVQPHAIAITQASEYGQCYRPDELAALCALARGRGWGVHMDGARFANAAAFLETCPSEVAGAVDTLSFGFIKNGGMSAEAVLFFNPEQVERARIMRKRAGHLQSKGRYLAAQILALLEDDLWLANGRAANRCAALIAEGGGDRLLYGVEANEVFVRLSAAERADLRAQGFAFYDWGAEAGRFVTSWNSREEDAAALGAALAAL